MQVFVLLFNAQTDNEGIHTLKITDSGAENEIPQDVVLAFETEDDATRFALLLEAQDFPSATVEGINLAEIKAFCQSAGLEMKLVPEGMLAMPPETNVENTDWQAESEVPPVDLESFRRQLEDLL